MTDDTERRRQLAQSLDRKNQAMLERVRNSGITVRPTHLDKAEHPVSRLNRKPGRDL